VFLFTGDSGEAFSYRDGWDISGVFRYTGEGQLGDMAFTGGNQAVRDHAAEGKDLLLFQALGKGKPVRYVGRFACEDWIIERRPDKRGNDRDAIVFVLKSLDADEETAEPGDNTAVERPGILDFEALKKRAYAAASPRSTPKATRAVQTSYQRTEAIRDYVLARARGVWESCRAAVPFQRKSGGPYLEPHHTRRVSDGGPDHPRWVGAICPNCHREIHFGKAGASKNTELETYLGCIEVEGEGTRS